MGNPEIPQKRRIELAPAQMMFIQFHAGLKKYYSGEDDGEELTIVRSQYIDLVVTSDKRLYCVLDTDTNLPGKLIKFRDNQVREITTTTEEDYQTIADALFALSEMPSLNEPLAIDLEESIADNEPTAIFPAAKDVEEKEYQTAAIGGVEIKMALQYADDGDASGVIVNPDSLMPAVIVDQAAQLPRDPEKDIQTGMLEVRSALPSVPLFQSHRSESPRTPVFTRNRVRWLIAFVVCGAATAGTLMLVNKYAKPAATASENTP